MQVNLGFQGQVKATVAKQYFIVAIFNFPGMRINIPDGKIFKLEFNLNFFAFSGFEIDLFEGF